MRFLYASLSLCKISFIAIFFALFHSGLLQAQSTGNDVDELKKMVLSLEVRVSALEERNEQLEGRLAMPSATQTAAALVKASTELNRPSSVQPEVVEPSPLANSAAKPPAILPTALPGGATLNFLLDGYYEYNFNTPPGRVNYLRAYDVLGNAFSINQADIVFAWDPDLEAKRRYGVRVDLQFGQATEAIQVSLANEPRPEIYRNIYQAYGTYIVPAGHGLNIDVGKWASSLGAEGNYTKDQMNYSRSYYFALFPFYHSGLRSSYRLNDKLALNYWLVNGTNQSEPTNSYKDELFGYVAQPAKALSWTFNYYIGQEHPDSTPAFNCPIPVQPGLCVVPISPAPNGKLHIFDTYATWQATPRLVLQGEADYLIQRDWANAAAGESSAPQHVVGGAGYAQYQLSPRINLAARAEYLSDRGGLFSGTTQALKETTGTYQYKLSDGFDAFLEYRRDWSNLHFFPTGQADAPSTHQDTATIGLVWWYGGKQGAW